MITRTVEPLFVDLFAQYPIVTVTGPRQSGKTSLCRMAFPDLQYVNLERPDQREFATEDPRGFLRKYAAPAILDEIQRVPDLVSYLQVLVDETQSSGQYILTGSRQFAVSDAVSQSLAGRTALLRLLPFSIGEALRLRPDLDTDYMLYAGFYPRIYDKGLEPTRALGDYFETYVERDVRSVSEIRNLSGFQKFVRLCAGRVGQLLNLQSLGNDAGVSHTTAREWLSVLEASYIIFLLPPFHANISKRLVKSPKLYFHDVGLASYLLGIERAGQIFTHPLKGGLFENLIVLEALKYRYNLGKTSNLNFYRDSNGNEVDLIYQMADKFVAIEIKAGETVNSHMFAVLSRIGRLLPHEMMGSILAYAGSEASIRSGTHVTGPLGFAGLLQEFEAQ